MEQDVRLTSSSSMPRKADHLCVLVHGLWGNPGHLDYIASALRERYDEDTLYILAVKRNSGNFTYDGIELGGERVAHEIEEALRDLIERGYNIKKFSIVGYSLGGLVSRYALGLLYSRGWFDQVEPVNFTTFASPHLGVRTPLRGVQNHLWNVFGARTISVSGRQLFMIDKFRDTGMPLLSLMGTPNSIFIRALEQFTNRCLYANIVNDRSAVYYTTGISRIDPFVDPESVNINYLKGYEPVILDPNNPLLPREETTQPLVEAFLQEMRSLLSKLPFYLFLLIFVPIGSVLFLFNAVIQNARSQKRIRLHDEGEYGSRFRGYKVPLFVQDVQSAVEDVYENINSSQQPEYLSDASLEVAGPEGPRRRRRRLSKKLSATEKVVRSASKDDDDSEPDEQTSLLPHFPPLALTPAQFDIIDALDSVGFRKYPVHIHKVRHSHAAMIVRMPRKRFDEGKTVVKHWLDTEFQI